ncbi:MAG: RDD family protein [Sphaerospermopsis sp. SIO1G2]|nr:RDD family protein [Sphaerospermopsis sp. SIO1G2]
MSRRKKNSATPPDHTLSAAEKALASLLGKVDELSDWQRRRIARHAQTGPVRYASFHDRIFATVIDVALMMFLLGPLSMWLSSVAHGTIISYPLDGLPPHASAGQMLAHLEQSGYLYAMLLDYGLHYVVMGVLILLCWHYYAATPGKWLLRMRIVDQRSYCKPPLPQLLRRYAAYLVTLLPATLGILWIMIDKKRRGWHDICGGTMVVKVDHWRIRDDGITPHVTPDETAHE